MDFHTILQPPMVGCIDDIEIEMGVEMGFGMIETEMELGMELGMEMGMGTGTASSIHPRNLSLDESSGI